MIKRILFLLLLFFANAAFAGDVWWGQNTGGVAYGDLDAATVCKELQASNGGGWTFTTVTIVGDNGGCNGTKQPTYPNPREYMSIVKNTCLGSTPYFDKTTKKCVAKASPPPVSCEKGTKTSEYYESIANGPPSNVGFPYCASSGCGILVNYVGGCVGGGGVSACLFKGETTGTVCNALSANQQSTNWGMGKETKPAGATARVDMPPTRAASDGAKCPTGSVQGGVDSSGIAICIGRGADPENAGSAPPVTTKAPVTTTNSDGSTTTKQDVVKTNADGSTTTTTTTTVKGADGSTSVSGETATSKTPAGTDGKADTPDKANLCKDNPTLSICQNSEVSGKCEETSCKGDAIQCATLRAAAAMQCKMKKDDEDLKAYSAYTLGAAAAAGNDPMSGTLPVPGKGEVVQMRSIETAGWLGSGAYFKDKTIDLGDGKSLVLPLSKTADVLIALRYISMIVASLVCFKIIRGTFSSSGV